MTLGIDPKVDYAFKWLFGNEKNTGILIHLLHAVLNPKPEEQIVEIQILNPFNDKVALDEKLSILDIKAKDQLGRLFNVEMQMLAAPALRQRILYYWAKLYTEQLQQGRNYELLRPTLSICFVDGVLFPAVSEHHLAFRLIDTAQGVALTDHLCIHFLELPKFQRSAEELTTPLDAWLYFLRHAEGLNPEALPQPLDTQEMRQAVEVLTMLTEIDIQKEIYEGRIKARLDEQMRLNYAMTEGRAQGLAEGREEGREEGWEEGREEGRAEGLTQGVEKGVFIGRIEFAQKLLRQEVTPRADLETMPLEALEQLAAQLEQDLSR